jgi:hypothetical protein
LKSHSKCSEDTSNSYVQNDMLLQIVYFSTEYSTAWIVFNAVLVAVAVLSSFILYANRVSLNGKLRAKKTVGFWIGLLLVIFFGA